MAAAKFGPCEAEIETRDILKRAPRRGKLRVELTFTLENLKVTDMTTKVSANSGSCNIKRFSYYIEIFCHGRSLPQRYITVALYMNNHVHRALLENA